MPYIGNVTTSSNVNGSQINNGTITGDKLSLPFDYDSATLYLDNTNNRVGILTASPSSTLTVDTGGVVSIPLASAATPSLIFGTDTNTGIYSPGADQVAISTGGSGRLFVDASGRISIGGSASSWNTFDRVFQNGNVSVAGLNGADNSMLASNLYYGGSPSDFRYVSSDTATLYRQTSGAHVFYSAASGTAGNAVTPSERLRITSAGLVGVGSSSPEETVDVNGAITWRGSLNTGKTSAGALDRSGNELRIRAYGATAGTGQLVFRTGGGGGSVDSEAMRIDSSQRVGIGVSSPAVTLEAKSSGNSVFRAWTSDTATSNQIVFDNISNYNYGVIGTVSGNSTATGDVFGLGYTAAYATDFTPVLSWTANTGRVGIGTTSPQFDCTVSKQGTGVTSYIGIRAGENGSASTSNAAVLYYRIRGGGPGDVDANITYSYNGAYLLQSSSQDGYTWNTSAGEAVRIDSSRRLLVGTSSTSTAALLQVQGNQSNSGGSGDLHLRRGEAASSITSGEGIGYIAFTDNAGGTFGTIECVADAAAGTNDYPGRLVFSTTADGAASPTERFRISSTGAQSSVIPGGSTLYPQFGCRAWVNFDGTGTVAIRASGNVSSITDIAAGTYTVNLTTSVTDANYSAQVTSGFASTVREDILGFVYTDSPYAMTASACTVKFVRADTNAAVDTNFAMVAIFR